MEGTILRRVIPSDNSCLFNAVGYVMDHDKNKAPELRQVRLDIRVFFALITLVIAATVASDPTQYSEAFLGKPNEEYCAWILNPEKWGGTILGFNWCWLRTSLLGIMGVQCAQCMPRCSRSAIELAILSDYYGREVAAYDIQTTRCDLYGQGKNYHERVMLIYDGLHYDALAMSPADGAPEEFDQTIFTVQKDGTVGSVERLALNLVKEQQSFAEFARYLPFIVKNLVLLAIGDYKLTRY
ncbi:OTU-like cysteine protease family protein [Actinidia rufa]|uniref:Ubiquitin thioesterase OTU n=1 Tax=Actinidia rufa TaxID=165716 RepID=A0A7J0G9K3_9ERIC|nr:OTU-like cysteine protease family protein [Actinidia rufa]